ncbi:hypothetical protein DSM107010_06020 [Chroococcidiopsis cubana SAG 39.79]|jgi:hypothetical protein|uniref:Uncharacterized protein n=1 Tax=Chroococcidiopsis cubana SAG 39.79 TaxID=388085 RepID=A0AB37URR3_9CYAN|nr:hypothetical protein DSM107010_06020 [Chroococcidiopsis cubana SAG 39.79]
MYVKKCIVKSFNIYLILQTSEKSNELRKQSVILRFDENKNYISVIEGKKPN